MCLSNKVFVSIFLFCLGVTAQAAHIRLVSMAPNITEIVFAAGAGHDLVGVSRFSDYPEKAKGISCVGDAMGVDMERLMLLKPDVVLFWSDAVSPELLEQLHALHIKTMILHTHTIPEVAQSIKQVGSLAKTSPIANTASDKLLSGYYQLKKRYSHRAKVSVFYQLSLFPLMTLNQHSLVSHMIQDCGGNNIFSNAETVAPVVSITSIIKLQPQVILISDFQSNEKSRQHYWSYWPLINAVKRKNVYSVNASWTERPGPRSLLGMQKICTLLQKVRTQNMKHIKRGKI